MDGIRLSGNPFEIRQLMSLNRTLGRKGGFGDGREGPGGGWGRVEVIEVICFF